MGTIRTFLEKRKAIREAKKEPAYILTVSPTPAGYTYTTEGKLISTPGTPALPGIGSPSAEAVEIVRGREAPPPTPPPTPKPIYKPTPKQISQQALKSLFILKEGKRLQPETRRRLLSEQLAYQRRISRLPIQQRIEMRRGETTFSRDLIRKRNLIRDIVSRKERKQFGFIFLNRKEAESLGIEKPKEVKGELSKEEKDRQRATDFAEKFFGVEDGGVIAVTKSELIDLTKAKEFRAKEISKLEKELKKRGEKIERKKVSPFAEGMEFRKQQKEALKLSKDTKRIFEALEKRGWSKDRIASLLTIRPEAIDSNLSFLSENKRNALKKFSKFTKNVVIGALESIEEKPEKIIAVTVGSIALPFAFAGIKGLKVTTKVLKKIPKPILKRGGEAVNIALGGLYLGSSGLQIAQQPTAELRARKVGNIITTEVIPFTIGTRLGVKGLLRTQVKSEINKEISKLPKNKQKAFEDYMKQAEILGKYEPSANNIKLNNIESIKSTKAQNTVRKFLKNNDVTVGGSVAQTGQVKVKRKLGDMDLYVKDNISLNRVAKRLADQLKKAGVKRVSNIRGQVTIDGKKAIEFHNINRLLRNIEEVIPIWQNPNNYIIKTPEGIKIQRIGLQARRKLIAGFVDPKRMATGKYKKDLKDFKKIADQLFKRAELNARSSFFFKEKKIKQLEKLFKKKISRKPLKIVKFKKPKKLIIKPSVKKVGVGIRKPPKISKKIKVKIPKKKLKRKLIIKKKLKKRKLTPSQRRIRKRKIKKLTLSQLKARKRRRRKVLPSQLPIKRKKRKIRPTKITKKKVKPRIIPSQLPVKPKKPIKKIPSKKPPKPIKLPKFKRIKPTKEIIVVAVRRKGKRKKKEVVRSYNVYARPLRKKGQKKQPKLIRINKSPLKKSRAEDLRNYIIDQSLSRTGFIKPTKLKPKKPLLKIPISYGKRTQKKFRTHRIRKGKRIKLKKGRVIEKGGKGKRNYLLDTISERKGINLKRRLAMLEKQSGFKPVKRKSVRRKSKRIASSFRLIRRPVRRTTSRPQQRVRRTTQSRTQPTKTKRTLSSAQLNALAKGRKILAQKRKRNK